MENLEKNGSCHVMAGNKRILIADASDVQKIELTDFKTKSITLRDGFTFAEIYAESIQIEVNENGGAYSHEIVCRFAGAKNKYDRLLDDMTRRRWIVKIVDNTDTVWLSGSLEEPLRFSFRHTGQAKADGVHLYALTFSRRMTEPLYTTTL